MDETSIYPNPVTDYLKLNLINSNVYSKEITIYDSQGRIILSANLISPEIQISTLESGVYYVHFVQNNENKILRFIKI